MTELLWFRIPSTGSAIQQLQSNLGDRFFPHKKVAGITIDKQISPKQAIDYAVRAGLRRLIVTSYQFKELIKAITTTDTFQLISIEFAIQLDPEDSEILNSAIAESTENIDHLLKLIDLHYRFDNRIVKISWYMSGITGKENAIRTTLHESGLLSFDNGIGIADEIIKHPLFNTASVWC